MLDRLKSPPHAVSGATPSVLFFYFFVLGISSLIIQVIAIRELSASFYGNEFFIGWVLFSWLLWTGLGSSMGSVVPREDSALPKTLSVFSFLIALISVLEIILIRMNRSFLGQAPGVLPDLIPSLIYAFLAMGPICFLLGGQFAIAGRLFLLNNTVPAEPGRAMGRVYLFETLGFIAGGILFSLLLVRANAFIAMSAVVILNFIAACLFAFAGRPEEARTPRIFFTFFMVLFILGSGHLENMTTQLRFPTEQLMLTKNTLRGNIAVTQLGEQNNFYQNGMLLGTDREEMANEYLVHFPMLAHPAPKRVLLLGTGLNGPLKEILKHNPEKVVSIDLDPEFNDLTAPYLPQDLQETLADPRIQFWHGDSRAFFRESPESFDVIIANFPDPTSILVARNYTEEFFRQVRNHLSPGGVFSTHLGFAANYVTPELERLGSSISATLREIFRDVIVLPEDTAYFLAAYDRTDLSDVAKMETRMLERGLSSDFATVDYLRYRFTNDRVNQVATIFDNSVWDVKNEDLKPQGYYFAFTRWLSLFHANASKVLLRVTEIPFAFILTGFLILLAGPLFFPGSPEGNTRRLSLTAMRTGGFTVMAFEIVLIYLFQVFFGNLYYSIAILITAMMAGIGLGAWAATLRKVQSSRIVMAGIHLFCAFFYTAMILAIYGAHKNSMPPGGVIFLFYGTAVLSGLLAGLEFPFASDLYLVSGRGKKVGAVYAADLFGSCLGALVTAGFLIPIWGVKRTLMLLISANAMLALCLVFRKD